MTTEENIRTRLLELRDEKYRDFNASLVPNIDKSRIIGVRTPLLRKMASQLTCDEAEEFLSLKHEYFEENNLHGFLIERIKDFDRCIAELERFLPAVDNWATCDSVRPKVLGRNPAPLLARIAVWLQSEHLYTRRFGIGMLLSFFLDENFSPEYLEWVARVNGEEYYISMMKAWYFATALAKHYDETVEYIFRGRLDKLTHNRTIQKALESRRIPKERKELLRSCRIRR